MSIYINPDLLANVVLYSDTLVSSPIHTCKAPTEGGKSVSMQFPMSNSRGYQVDLRRGNPPPLSQIAALEIENLCSIDALIIIPESGQEIAVAPGETILVPVFAPNPIPVFYVTLGKALDTVNGGASEFVINIVALNIYIPFFRSKWNTYIQDQFTNKYVAFNGSSAAWPLTLVTANKILVRGVQLKVNATAAVSWVLNTVGINNGSNLFLEGYYGADTIATLTDVFNLTGLNTIVEGNLQISGSTNGLSGIAGFKVGIQYDILERA